ncbi:MAG TPA: M20/M25/M40 family metallo-hydrolase [Roseiflexaceae bacterium]|nr:M20/M25/M40 family metallo-hydrolase [Roseiflexaceae bacterium]HMP43044.1 M20/M25/M40 family metallo-hydrolase [Roseiflexaceae bacterium]
MTEPAFILTDRLIDDLDAVIALPGSTGHTEALAGVATRIAMMMRSRGLTVESINTTGAPIVIGRRAGRSPFTLLLYHHYDSAPAGPWRAWHSEPFRTAERESTLYGRGVAAGKGPLVAHLNAIAALIEAEGELPCSIVVVAEGEALGGSPSLGRVLIDQRDLVRADACLATAGDRDAAGVPICYSGVKGLLQLQLRSQGAAMALPGGRATVIANPLWRLIWALGQIKNDQEEILIEGFYDTIEGLDRDAIKALRAARLDEQHRLEDWQIPQFLFGMTGNTLTQAEATLPTCNIAAISAEPISELAILPTSAAARVDFQLVPRQQSQVILDLLRSHLNTRGYEDIGIERMAGGYPAAGTLTADIFVQRVAEVGRTIFGATPAILPRGPFALPLFFIGDMFHIPLATVGCSRTGSASFDANEHIAIADLVQHGQFLIELIYSCAQQ